MNKRKTYSIACALLAAAVLFSPGGSVYAEKDRHNHRKPRKVMYDLKIKAAKNRVQKQDIHNQLAAPIMPMAISTSPAAMPDYFNVPNYAYSPSPVVDTTTAVISGGIRKFVDSLPGLGPTNANSLGQYIPVATPIANPEFPNDDYYEIGVIEYTQKMHSDLPDTTQLRGYVDLSPASDKKGHYLGPLVLAKENRPVRVKFINQIATGDAGRLFIPVDTTIMGAGMGPYGMTPPIGSMDYSENRATLHLHGGNTPWISDGTPHQWTAPAGEVTSYPKGISTTDVPDMQAAGPGEMTFYYPNQQSSRLMFYHDHVWGITRLNVYAGVAAGYLLVDNTEEKLINDGALPNLGGLYRYGIPLIIQDKTFVPDPDTLARQDPTWKWGPYANLWFPHVYMPAQNPNLNPGLPTNDPANVNIFGRWDYGPWADPTLVVDHGPTTITIGTTTVQIPGTPNPSQVPEAFMDTPIINGTPYPYVTVQRTAYRFRVLNACNDRFMNLQLYYVDPANPTEVKMVPAVVTPGFPADWPTDSRAGGVPDPSLAGPVVIQIGSEGGLLPTPAVIPAQPVTYDLMGNVDKHALLLGCAERADIIVDFSQVPAGAKLILYNDAPAPTPGGDPLYDFYTGNQDLTAIGGAPSTLPGYGPNTRTLMQIIVDSTAPASPAFDLGKLQTAFNTTAGNTGAFAASQPAPLVPQSAYNAAFNASFPNTYSALSDTSLTFTPVGSTTPVTLGMLSKSVNEGYDPYGRINARLGTGNFTPVTLTPFGYTDAPTEFIKDAEKQLWRITHNGMDTHPIHVHLFNAQVVNRIMWDGTVKPPDPNELGWKETVRMSPMEDVVVALQPKKQDLPFPLPDSVRPLDPSMPVSLMNPLTNFGWEYVWHCHILGHEENDMMRPMVFQVAPGMPTNLNTARAGQYVNVFWTDRAASEDGFTLQQAQDANFSVGVTSFTVPASSPNTAFGGIIPFTDMTVGVNTTYYYRVQSFGVNGISDWSGSASIFLGAPPAPATVLTAVQAGPHRINLAWSYTAGTNPATGFRIERAPVVNGSTGTFTSLGTVPPSTFSYPDNTAPDGTTVAYRVIAFNEWGDASPSNTPTLALPLAAPSNLAANLSGQAVSLSWTNNSISSPGFLIQRAEDAGFTVALASFTAGTNATSFTDTSAVAGKTYFYQVQAVSGNVVSAWAQPASITIAGPAASAVNLAAKQFGPHAAKLAWMYKANSNRATGFRIERAEVTGGVPGAFTAIGTVPAPSGQGVVPPTAHTFTDANAPDGKTLVYRVVTYNSWGDSAPSNTAKVTLPLAAPSNLCGVTFHERKDTVVKLTWRNNSISSPGFKIQRAKNYRFTKDVANFSVGTNVTCFTDTNVKGPERYYYRVKACTATGKSAWSDIESVNLGGDKDTCRK